jgi:hypothetical protein
MTTGILCQLSTWLSIIELYLTKPEDSTQLQHWVESAEELAEQYLESDELLDAGLQILAIYKKYHEQLIQKTNSHLRSTTHIAEDAIDRIMAHMNELCVRPQIEQRTEAWYEQIAHVLGASELDDIFASPRTRAIMVMSKAFPQHRPSQPLAVFSNHMSAFDWGIRFEPIVKKIYELKYNAEVKELGRLVSNIDSRVSASPDGLVYSGPKLGRLLEIKCPVTREPDGTISKKYYNQMQSQLFVTGIEYCDFVEAVFVSKYSTDIPRHGPGLYCGEILLIETINDDACTYSYLYSDINPTEEFHPILRSNQTIVEHIPWSLYSWHEQIVHADPHWWPKIKPAVDLFWEDVEKAKRGEFIVPDAKPRKTKEHPCLIVIKQDNNEEQQIQIPT